MAKKKAGQKRIVYYPPPSEVIDRFARDVCIHMEQKVDGACNTPEIVGDFSRFIKVIASAYAKYLTKHPESSSELDNQEE